MIEFRGVTKVFPGNVRALDDVNLTIPDGQFVVVVGPSGAGKSTLLRSINRLVTVTSGQVLIDGHDIGAAQGEDLRRLRRQVAMIFQNFNLVRRSSVLRNVLAGRLGHMGTLRSVLGLFPPRDVARAFDALKRVEIVEKAYVRADQLSGGQQQRVSIARALCQEARFILADEPVASLDPPTSHVVLQDLRRINRELGITTIVNLHFVDLAKEYAERIVGLRAGRVVFDGPAGDVDESTFERIYGRGIHAGDIRGSVA